MHSAFGVDHGGEEVDHVSKAQKDKVWRDFERSKKNQLLIEPSAAQRAQGKQVRPELLIDRAIRIAREGGKPDLPKGLGLIPKGKTKGPSGKVPKGILHGPMAPIVGAGLLTGAGIGAMSYASRRKQGKRVNL